MAGASKRPFWMHQVVEYILGGALIASGLQSPTPVIPSVLGAVVMLHAAVTIGPAAAFRVMGRRVHRVVDVGVLAAEVAAGAQPWVDLESATRVTILGIAAVHLFVWWQTNFAERVKSRGADAEADRSTEIGRIAGRLVGNSVNAVRRQRDDR
ncbi:MAG TPA: hypothetical protein VLD86_07795 [Ilumatobacteraceae bacterium]|nr:hypothetical protein [Ilumatobacteraceae bacterium]